MREWMDGPDMEDQFSFTLQYYGDNFPNFQIGQKIKSPVVDGMGFTMTP